jgi:hypothetical protein
MAKRRAQPAISPVDPQQETFDKLQQWFKQARDHSHKWRLEARLCYDFVAGEQWTEKDAALMRLQNRPVVTFNRTASVVDSVSGLEIANRQETRFIPRQLGAAGVNELLTSAVKWIRDECQAEDEESDSFMDAVICGEGCTETRIDYDEDPDGKIAILRTDPLEMFVDGASRRANHSDARHIFRVRQLHLEVAREMFPDAEDEDLNAAWAADVDAEAKEPHDAMQAPFYRNDQSPDIEKATQMVTLVEAQWWEHENGFRVADPTQGKLVTVSKDQHDQLQKRAKMLGIAVWSAPYKRRVYKRAFLGSKVLKIGPGPQQGGFSYKFITGKRDRNHGVWYGLVRAMIDPQRWANKWLAQVMHIINTNAKGGILAEEDAFENAQEAIDTWADPSAVTVVTAGALTSGKIQPKPQVPFPAGISQLMEFAISSIRDVSGVNLELLGMAATDQPGVVEAHRKQAGMTILAGMFDSLRQYRKEQGKLLLWLITTFLSDGRLIRIGGPQEAQYVPLVRDPNLAEYDVIVDDTPTSANMKEQTWAAILQLMPFLARLPLPPMAWLQMLKESPLPASFTADLINAAQQQMSQPPPPNPLMIQAQARAQTEQAKAQWHNAQAQAEAMRAQGDIAESLARRELVQAQAFNQYATGEMNMAKAGASQNGASIEAMEFILGQVRDAWQQQQQMQAQPQPQGQSAQPDPTQAQTVQ